MKACHTCVNWAPNRKAFADRGKFCLHPSMQKETDDRFVCGAWLDPATTELNVPQHTAQGIKMSKSPQKIDGPVHMLIVTYAKDVPWLEYCLKSIDRHCTGFSGVTIAHPTIHAEIFKAATAPFNVRLHAYEEVPGTGMLQHMVKMAQAEQLVPSDTKLVMHLDSDCIWKMRSTPEDFFTSGKPDYLYRTYASLSSPDPLNPMNQIISDCAQWQGPTEYQLGFPCPDYTMTRHPTVFPIDFYKPYRKHIADVHRLPFEAFMLAGRNAHPQDRMDFTAMGAWARKFMRDRFHWIDTATGIYPEDRLKAYWSHGGISPQIREEIQSFLR